ncbi:MAG: SDR family NAD(P)-dependent oxidoreductase [Aromatoleum sp.]|nr:SDR family NAD(P)-dependent oxidoreductase [Aromatoleum sp.]
MGLFAPLNPLLAPWPRVRVWVIGASYGIGAATAQELLRAGARVAISARSEDKLRAVAAGDPRALIAPLDFTQGSDVAAAWERIRAEWGGCDLVLIVAGTHKEIRAWELNEAEADALLEVNLNGPIATVAAVLPGLLAQGTGAIGIVSSVAGYRGLPKALIYGASKAGLINFTETLYLDLQPRGFGVYLINPGFVATPLTEKNQFNMPHLITADEAAQEIIAGIERGDFEIHFPRAFTRQLKFLRLLPYRLYFAAVRKATGL